MVNESVYCSVYVAQNTNTGHRSAERKLNSNKYKKAVENFRKGCTCVLFCFVNDNLNVIYHFKE